MKQKVNYIPIYYPIDDRILSIAYQLIMSFNNTSSSSTNLSSNEPACAAPDINTAANLWTTQFVNSINTSETPTHAPPGYPEVPQHPPPAPSTYNAELLLPSIKDEYVPKFRIKPVTVTPPAPSPMRHPYYDHPEFMKRPIHSNS